MGYHSVLIVYCLLVVSFGHGRYINNVPVAPFPYQTTLGLLPYQYYPLMPPTNPYQTMPWMHPFFPNLLPNYQGLYPSNRTGWMQPVNYPLNMPLYGPSYPNGWAADETRDHIGSDSELYRAMLSLDADNSQVSQSTQKPRLQTSVDKQTKNMTNVSKVTKSIVFQKTYTTTLRRSFIIEPINSKKLEPINKEDPNDVEITTVLPESTTEILNTTDKNFNQTSRRFIDVPKSCPDGYALNHKGSCIKPFFL